MLDLNITRQYNNFSMAKMLCLKDHRKQQWQQIYLISEQSKKGLGKKIIILHLLQGFSQTQFELCQPCLCHSGQQATPEIESELVQSSSVC